MGRGTTEPQRRQNENFIAFDLTWKTNAPDHRKTKCLNGFKDQLWLKSFFLRKAALKSKDFTFLRSVNQTSTTQPGIEHGINKLADIQLQSKTKRKHAQEAREFNDQTMQNGEEGPRI